MPPHPPTAGIILAGGHATRMGGGDKCRLLVQGRPLIDRILSAIRPQTTALALNANGNPARFADLALPVLPDPVPGQPGPLAGILAGLLWAEANGHPWLLTVPGDTPFLPPDLVLRLHDALRATPAATHACAASAGHLHPVIALWPTTLRPAVTAALAANQLRVRRLGAPTAASWPVTPQDPFLNLNTPTDLRDAGRTSQARSATPRDRHRP